jgi:hypothetical protein
MKASFVDCSFGAWLRVGGRTDTKMSRRIESKTVLGIDLVSVKGAFYQLLPSLTSYLDSYEGGHGSIRLCSRAVNHPMTYKRSSGKHEVQDDFTFSEKHVNFGCPQNREPSIDQDETLAVDNVAPKTPVQKLVRIYLLGASPRVSEI